MSDLQSRRRRADTSPQTDKQPKLTMENTTCYKSDIDHNALIKMCFEMCSTLKETGSKFSFALKLDPGFNFAVTSEGKHVYGSKATTKRHRSASYLRRQAKRHALFLERKRMHISEEEATKTRQDKSVCEQETGVFLNKKSSTSVQTVS